MKSLFTAVALVVSLAIFPSVSTFSAVKTDSVKVWGNCEMCKTRIEKAAKAAGATSANWNIDTHVLTVKFADGKTSLKAIEEQVAGVGHDTEHLTAPTEVYNKLHGCCQYDRKGEQPTAANSCCDGKACSKDKCNMEKCSAGSTAACCASHTCCS